MAIELRRYGIPIRIVDKAASRTKTSKALSVWSRTLELLDRTGLDWVIADVAIDGLRNP
jgi:2-polyprenyl-6-methoxyphenol hydroxylase-like FAD-dependent oxidoreductase